MFLKITTTTKLATGRRWNSAIVTEQTDDGFVFSVPEADATDITRRARKMGWGVLVLDIRAEAPEGFVIPDGMVLVPLDAYEALMRLTDKDTKRDMMAAASLLKS